MQYCDRSPLSVAVTSTVARAYSVFRKLGLRHLVVKQQDGKVVGMVTRKDLMVFKLVDYQARELELVKNLQQHMKDRLAAKGYYSSKRGSGSSN